MKLVSLPFPICYKNSVPFFFLSGCILRGGSPSINHQALRTTKLAEEEQEYVPSVADIPKKSPEFWSPKACPMESIQKGFRAFI